MAQLSSGRSPHFPHLGIELWTSQAIYCHQSSYWLRVLEGKRVDVVALEFLFQNILEVLRYQGDGWHIKNTVPALMREIYVYFLQKIKLLPFWTQSGILDQLFVKILLLALGGLCLGKPTECALDLHYNLCLFWAISRSCQQQCVCVCVRGGNNKAPRLKSKIQRCFRRTRE